MPETRYEQGAIGTAPEPPIIALPYRSGSMDSAAQIWYGLRQLGTTSRASKNTVAAVFLWFSGHDLTLLSHGEQA